MILFGLAANVGYNVGGLCGLGKVKINSSSQFSKRRPGSCRGGCGCVPSRL
jgi:hypothetical protein